MAFHLPSDSGTSSRLLLLVTNLCSWLIRIQPNTSGPKIRRMRLLSIILITFIVVIVGILFAGIFHQLSSVEMLLVTVPVIFYIIAYGLNRTGHNSLAAALTIGVVFIVVLASAISQHNSIMVGFVLIPLFLTCLFLSVRFSLIVFVVTMIGVFLVPRLFSGWYFSYYSHLMFLIGIIGALTVITSAISQQDIGQIEEQSHQLANENIERQRIERELRKSRDELEIGIAERTTDLDLLNQLLKDELAVKETVGCELKKSEERFRSIYENASEGIFQSTLDGSYLHVNNAMAQIFGYKSPAEMIAIVGHDIGHKVHLSPESRTRYLELLKKKGEIKGFEALNLRKDDSQIWTSTNARLVTNTKGEGLYTEGFIIDITKRKLAEYAVKTSETRFRNLFESAPISLWEEDFSSVFAFFDKLHLSGIIDFRDYFESHPEAVANCAGMIKIIKVNEATLKLFQAKSNNDFIKGIDKIFCEESFPTFREELIALAEGKTRFISETLNQTLTGEKIHIAMSLTVAPSSDESAHRVFVSINDISKYKLAEKAIQQSNEKLSRAVTELGMRNSEMAALTEMGELFQACQTTAEASAIISKFAPKLFTKESGSLSVFNASRNVLDLMATWGQVSKMERPFSPNDCWALRLGKIHIADSPGSEMVCSHLLHLLPAVSLCIPLAAQGEALGLLSLIKTRLPEIESITPDVELTPFSDERIQLATAFAEHVGLGLANLKLRDALRYEAVHDSLTNLYNRRYMEETFEREIKRVERKGTPLGIIMMDIDYFKDFNDTFGHEAGDIILREFGNFFRTHIRAEDIACRYGGDEFTLILPDASLDDTRTRAKELGEGVKQLNTQYNGKTLGVISLSLGISIFPEHGKTVESLLRSADKALYRAKAEGRDRVVVAS
ncbi:MAG: diguanylate cyclase [Anaerolineaceae bacterium]